LHTSLVIPALRADIAYNMGGFFGLNDTAFLPYILIVSFNGSAIASPSARRPAGHRSSECELRLLSSSSQLSTFECGGERQSRR